VVVHTCLHGVEAGLEEGGERVEPGVGRSEQELLDVGQGEGIGEGNVGDGLGAAGHTVLVVGTCGLKSSQRGLTTLSKSCMSTRKRQEYCIMIQGGQKIFFLGKINS
jgi:hypothetical protein